MSLAIKSYLRSVLADVSRGLISTAAAAAVLTLLGYILTRDFTIAAFNGGLYGLVLSPLLYLILDVGGEKVKALRWVRLGSPSVVTVDGTECTLLRLGCRSTLKVAIFIAVLFVPSLVGLCASIALVIAVPVLTSGHRSVVDRLTWTSRGC